jgi:hypothetical protein
MRISATCYIISRVHEAKVKQNGRIVQSPVCLLCRLFSDSIPGTHQDPDHGIFPLLIIRLTVNIGTAVPDMGQERIVRTERPDVLDPPDPSPGMIEDEKTPATVITADFRAGQMDGTVGQLASGLVAEEWAGVG